MPFSSIQGGQTVVYMVVMGVTVVVAVNVGATVDVVVTAFEVVAVDMVVVGKVGAVVMTGHVGHAGGSTHVRLSME